jgi:hypothetical protein
MNRPPITFRLTEEEWLLLESNRRDRESINLAAARLLRERLGIYENGVNNLEVKTFHQAITAEVNQCKQEVNSYIDTKISELLARIEILESSPKAPRRSPARSSTKKPIDKDSVV